MKNKDQTNENIDSKNSFNRLHGIQLITIIKNKHSKLSIISNG